MTLIIELPFFYQPTQFTSETAKNTEHSSHCKMSSHKAADLNRDKNTQSEFIVSVNKRFLLDLGRSFTKSQKKKKTKN